MVARWKQYNTEEEMLAQTRERGEAPTMLADLGSGERIASTRADVRKDDQIVTYQSGVKTVGVRIASK